MILWLTEKLQRRYSKKICSLEGYNPLICTRGLGDYEVYDWFRTTQRFPSKFLRKIFSRQEILESKNILDPFMGSGNTLVACLEFGKIGHGIDISPLFWFITHVKTSKYSKKDFRHAMAAIKKAKNSGNLRPPSLTSFGRLFIESQLRELMILRERAYDLGQKPRQILLFALVSKLIDLSRAKRYGKGLRLNVRRGRPPSVRKKIALKIKRMENSYMEFLSRASTTEGRAYPIVGDCRKIPFKNARIEEQPRSDQIDLVLTSPPYCNSGDYIEMYKLEHWFLDFVSDYDEFRSLSNSTVRSHTTFSNYSTDWKHPVLDEIISELEKKHLWNPKIPQMILGYFDDLHKSLNQIYSTLHPGKVLMVLGNSCYSQIVIPTDLIISEAAVDLGFKVERIEVMRQLVTSGQQFGNLDKKSKALLRESIVNLVVD